MNMDGNVPAKDPDTSHLVPLDPDDPAWDWPGECGEIFSTDPILVIIEPVRQ